MADRVAKRDHMLELLPDPRRRCHRRVSLEFNRCRRGCTAIEIINDQHTTVKAPIDHGLKVGDFVALSPSHPCTTFGNGV